jgi:hypothetical protein
MHPKKMKHSTNECHIDRSRFSSSIVKPDTVECKTTICTAIETEVPLKRAKRAPPKREKHDEERSEIERRETERRSRKERSKTEASREERIEADSCEKNTARLIVARRANETGPSIARRP